MVVVVDPRFPRLLEELRRERGLSLRRFARLVNYSHTYLWEIETGRKQPTVQLAAAVDAALGASGRLAELVAERPAPPAGTSPATTVMRAGDVVLDREQLEELAASAWSTRPGADGAMPAQVIAAGQWALLASWLYEVFVRRRPRLMRLSPGRYSRRWRDESGLTPFRLEAAAQGRTPHTECRSVMAVVAPPEIAERLGLSADSAIVVRRENWYYADGEPVQLGVTYMLPVLAERAALAATTTPEGGGLYARLDRAGYRLVRAREEIQARLPLSDEATALRLSAGVPVLEVLHTGYGANARPIEVTRFVLRADLIGIDCELRIEA